MNENEIKVKIVLENYDEIVGKLNELKKLLQEVNKTDIDVEVEVG